MEAQGYVMNKSYFEQDNESAIKLERNGRMSAGPKSRHVNIRYFWIKDRTKANGIQIRHCPTVQMLADFFTKPLQGALFTTFRDVILGYQPVDSLHSVLPSALEERVGSERASSGSTSGENDGSVDEDGFTLVTAKNKYARKNTTTGNLRTTNVDVRSTRRSGESELSSRCVLRSFSRNNPVNVVKA